MPTFELRSLVERFKGAMSENARIGGLAIDTRKIKNGDLFVALKGERVDGHDYVVKAREAGAAAAIVEHPVDDPLPQWQVQDAERAMGEVASCFRERFEGRVAAVTGSNGKTTTRNLIASICRAAGPTLATEGNLNNHLGCPLTLSRLAGQSYAVIELGASGLGEIAWTASLAKPHVSLITNASGAHLKGFGSLAGIRKAKGEILDHLPEDGVAVLNLDDPAYEEWEQRSPAKVFAFSLHNPSAKVYLRSVSTEPDGTMQMAVVIRGYGQFNARMPLLGMHNAQNACAAVAVAHALGVDMGAMMRGLESVRPEPGRLCPRKLRSGQLILDDSYNANPTSMRAGLEVLTSMPGPHVAVLGSMGELGDEEVSLHQALGKTAKAMGVDYLVCAGVFAADMARGFGEGAVAVEDAARAAEWLKNNMTADKAATMLVKGSRSAHMEIVVRALCDQWGEQDALLADTMAD